ncbi:Shikimate dehydrogenase (NADP(+)) [Geodia barretti]|uniref:Shikimate dehydrogenase (NADP(+)) n=1 Tax=Geodia barretti TaxID=519541 RepID=A0AA35VS88_GEOBA|nr:Shikimate dehydrogenase (NADP(+)) [Geodia barretti]
MPIETALGIIGNPIGHSISPLFQQAALDHLGIDAEYRAYEVQPEAVGNFVGSLRAPNVQGNQCNRTAQGGGDPPSGCCGRVGF